MLAKSLGKVVYLKSAVPVKYFYTIDFFVSICLSNTQITTFYKN